MILRLSMLIFSLMVARKLSVVGVVKFFSRAEYLRVVKSVQFFSCMLVVILNTIAIFIVNLLFWSELSQA